MRSLRARAEPASQAGGCGDRRARALKEGIKATEDIAVGKTHEVLKRFDQKNGLILQDMVAGEIHQRGKLEFQKGQGGGMQYRIAREDQDEDAP